LINVNSNNSHQNCRLLTYRPGGPPPSPALSYATDVYFTAQSHFDVLKAECSAFQCRL